MLLKIWASGGATHILVSSPALRGDTAMVAGAVAEADMPSGLWWGAKY